ncbi:hypothetical protein GALMADRAFT_400548 [Galerina marginata CBS 339.88]|uniref:Uncharacterized protein n=1 Tax=Galerina marginata (strain CBS 339.88) TaxID=685588 RepID=A0A067TSB8_GALM3|nr:hypothetical protein GALMADRAFT_400548 [Galerina marginata CBS 339.88]
MQAFLEHLCAGDNWRKLTKPEGFEGLYLEKECVILEWLHRQLDQDPTLPLLDCFREQMVQITSQIYEQRVLPTYMVPYFSNDLQAEETWLLSIKFPPPDHGLQKQHPASEHTIAPYNINYNIQLHQLTNGIGISSRITAIMEKWAHHPPIDRVQCYTHFLEYHLLSHAIFFHTCITDKTHSPTALHNRSSPKYFCQWFSNANPSTKILVGLWTLCYLLRWVETKWEPPKGFCSGAISFLEV